MKLDVYEQATHAEQAFSGALSVTIAMESAVSENYENRRSSRRVRTLKKGTIVLSGGYSVFDCVVRNLSHGGAMLQVGGLGIPSHFLLIMDAAVPRHPCTVRWRSGTAVGVSFDDIAQAA